MVLLQDPPLARSVASRQDLQSAAVAEPKRRIESAQNAVRAAAEQQGARVTGATRNLLNAVFISGTAGQAEALRTLPGVADVVKLRPIRRHMNRALDLVNAPAAWSALGGQQNAGKGMKIGIIDTGIDQRHAAFNDPSLNMPAGFPKCRPQECAYTNSKVIAARSYVDSLAAGNGTPEDSRPDDVSPRDRVGHGTAVAMIAAGVTNQGPAATITGVAPKAWLGNYKIFGSPGVNDVTFLSQIAMALDDAFQDGMDVVTMSLGYPALWTYKDFGKDCNASYPATQPCDPFAAAVENASAKGMSIVVSAGNDGDLGHYPNLNSINTPGAAPSVITVGATTNAHTFFSTARVAGANVNVPAQLATIYTLFSDGPRPAGPLQAPVRDVATLGDDGTACSPLSNGSLNSAIALVLRSDKCTHATKIQNAQKAGAVAVVIYRDSGNLPYRMTGLSDTGIPSALIGNAAGIALKSYLAGNAGTALRIDPALVEYTGSDFVDADEIAYFSSQGPAIGDLLIKPELVAPGAGIYTATQTYDPNGDVYDPSGYTVQQGTSYSVPMVAAAVALVKQHLPGATAGQLKSAVVNTADPSNIIDFDANNNIVPARVTAMGAGKLNAGNAVRTTITAEPATLSFGEVSKGALPSKSLRISNFSNAPASVALTVVQRDADTAASVRVNPASLTVPANGTATATVQLSGSNPAPGSYEGAIVIKGGPVDLRVPYLYLAGNGIADNIFQVQGFGWSADANTTLELDFKAVDKYGVPVPNLAHKWSPAGSIDKNQGASKVTDALGFGYAVMDVPPQIGDQTFSVDVSGFPTLYFTGRATLPPAIQAGGVVNAASGQVGQGVAPGSYISIYGRGLSPSFRVATTPYLPLSLANVSVSFDAPQAKLSLPGRLLFVSDGQINVQVPWELQGFNTVQMKVSIGSSQSALYTVPLADYSPAFIETCADATTGRPLVCSLDENYKLVSSSNPVAAGHVIQLYANGLGPVDQQPATGEVSPATEPLARNRVTPEVTIGGQKAQVLFSGLAPGYVGLYQINAVVPPGAGSGFQPIVVNVNGFPSKSSNIVVQ